VKKNIAMLFPGQGSQSIGMGLSFYVAREKLSQTAYTQPAILLVSIIAYKLFEKEMTISPAYASGAIDYLDALELVHERGKLMQEACSKIDAGMMAVIGLDDEHVMSVCSTLQNSGKQIWAANFNQNGQVVVAGLKQDLQEAVDFFKTNGAKKAILLDMSVASHCDLLKSAQEPLQDMMKHMLKNKFSAPVDF